MEQKQKLRPIVYTSNYFKSGAQNDTQQKLLLKALQVTQDPKKLKEMIGVKTVAEVYRTLDKMAMRKEYHESLAKAGISFDYVVGGLKQIADTAEKDADRLKAFQTILKSVGMDTYKESAGGMSGSWEEVLMQKIEESKESGVVPELAAPPQYEVSIPEIPDSVKKIRAEEKEVTSTLYEKPNIYESKPTDTSK